MYIRFLDTRETFKIIGERRQFWIFDKNGQMGKAIKGSDAYQLLEFEDTLPVVIEYDDTKVRDEINEEEYKEQFESGYFKE